MISVLSATEHDYYAMPLPFAVYSWRKLGIHCIVFVPEGNTPKLVLSEKYCFGCATFKTFKCEENRIPTYSQVSRLFASALPDLPENAALITADSDMAVFYDKFYLMDNGEIHIIGPDLTPADQFPMCYCIMPVKSWRGVFGITKSYQEHLSELIDPIEGQNIRGEQWCLDQWLLKKKVLEYEDIQSYRHHNRAKEGTQFAKFRADRDGWHFDPYNLFDAHLPRPLTDIDNFQKVVDLFAIKYPEDDLSWMFEFYNEYIKLL